MSTPFLQASLDREIELVRAFAEGEASVANLLFRTSLLARGARYRAARVDTRDVGV